MQAVFRWRTLQSRGPATVYAKRRANRRDRNNHPGPVRAACSDRAVSKRCVCPTLSEERQDLVLALFDWANFVPGIDHADDRLMKFLKQLMNPPSAPSVEPTPTSSFEKLSESQLEEHLAVARYGSFLLTDAVRPAFDLDVVPSAGYRRDCYNDKENGAEVPVLMAAETKERLFDLFLDLLDPLGTEVDVVLESSHDGGKKDSYREQMELPILKSLLLDFEDLLTNDGCTGIAVLNPRAELEVQFDEHKLLVVYGRDLIEFEQILDQNLLRCSDDIRFITEGEHVHSSSEEHRADYEQLAYRLGIDEYAAY